MKTLFLTFFLLSGLSVAQNFTKEDSLKGSDTQFRNFWDVKKYEITVEPKAEDRSVQGTNKITFEVTKDANRPTFQIDLQQPMTYTSISSDFPISKKNIRREGDFIFIQAEGTLKKGKRYHMNIDFSGHPTLAKNAPWDGGWVFAKDEQGNPWITVAQEGIGASVWLPIKDIWNDEPDEGILMHIITPKDLVGVGNGRLIGQRSLPNKTIFTWEVKNTINPYSIVPTIGKLAHFHDVYPGEKGNLDLDYWVLEPNVEKAKKHFQIVHPMMKAFEYWFGAYPVPEISLPRYPLR